MRPLSPELSLERLARAGNGSLFLAPVFAVLCATNLARELNRRAMIHFIVSIVLLLVSRPSIMGFR